MGFGFGQSRRKRNSNYVAPPVGSYSPSSGFAQSAASHLAGYGGSRSTSLTSLSELAAAAALKSNHTNYSQAGNARANSLSSRTFRSTSNPTVQRANSLSHYPTSSRSNSLRSYSRPPSQVAQPPQPSPQPRRTSSLTSNSSILSAGVASTTVTTRQGKDPNTVIRITRELGYDGRTKSLVKETISKMGSFEVVKTTTIKSPPAPHDQGYLKAPPAPSAYYSGSILSAGDSELDKIAEEFDMDYNVEHDVQFGSVPEEIEELREEEERDIQVPLPIPEVPEVVETPEPQVTPKVVKQDEQETPQSQSQPQEVVLQTPLEPPLAPAESSRHAYRQLTQVNDTSASLAEPVSIKSALKTKRSTQFDAADTFVKPAKKPVAKRQRHRAARGERYEDENGSDSGGSVYSDAYDLLPSAANGKLKKSIMKNSDVTSNHSSSNLLSPSQRQDSMTSSTRKSVRINAPLVHYNSQGSSPKVAQQGFKKPKAELTPEQLYMMALDVAREKVYGSHQVDAHDGVGGYEDEGYNSDSSFRREYPRPAEEHRLTMRDSVAQPRLNSLKGGRTMSLTMASGGDRKMSLKSNSSYNAPETHGREAAFNRLTMRDGSEKKPLFGRSGTLKADRKLDKRNRKQYMKLLEQERKEASILLSEKLLGLQSGANEAEAVEAEPVQASKNSPSKHHKSRFSIFGKKSKKESSAVAVEEPVVREDEEPVANNNMASDNMASDNIANDNIYQAPLQKEQTNLTVNSSAYDRSANNTSSLGPGSQNNLLPSPVALQNSLEVAGSEDFIPEQVSNSVVPEEDENFIDAPLSPGESMQQTPTLSLSNHHDENSSEPKTLEENDAPVVSTPRPLDVYSSYNESLDPQLQTSYGKSLNQERTPAAESYYTNNTIVNSTPIITDLEGADSHQQTSNVEAKKQKKQKKVKKNKRSFGKKVLGWFDLDD